MIRFKTYLELLFHDNVLHVSELLDILIIPVTVPVKSKILPF